MIHYTREKAIVEKLGMKFVSLPMLASEAQSPKKIDQVLSIITDKSQQPVFVHCQAGKDRTGLVFAAYRMKYDHWSQADAVEEMLAYGYDRDCCSDLEKSLIKWAAER